MTRLVTATCLAVAFAITLAAQTPQQPQQPPTPTPTPQSTPQQEREMQKDENEVTLTGCVQAGTEPNSFTLTNVTGGPEMTRAEAQTNVTYELSAGAGVSLQEHVGHKVQVTGTIEEGAAAQARAQARVPGQPPERATATAGGEKKLNVTNVRHISPTCP